MSCWDLLGIPEGSDISKIKKAYSKRLKKCHPEDDAEGYQELREAYNKAKKLTKKKLVSIELDILNDNPNKKEKKSKEESKFFNRVQEVYSDFSLRVNGKIWRDLLEFNFLWNVGNRKILEKEMLLFLSKHKYLPKNIWRIIDNYFDWTSNEIELYKNNDKEIVDTVINAMKVSEILGYEYIDNIPKEYIETFLNLRNKGYKCLKERKFDLAKGYLLDAYSIYQDDLYLINILGDYNVAIKDLNFARSYYRKALSIKCNDLHAMTEIGNTYFQEKNYVKAIKYFERSFYMYNLQIDEENYEAYLNLAKCYCFINKLEKAKEILEKLLEISPLDTYCSVYLKNVNKKIEEYNERVKEEENKKREGTFQLFEKLKKGNFNSFNGYFFIKNTAAR